MRGERPIIAIFYKCLHISLCRLALATWLRRWLRQRKRCSLYSLQCTRSLRARVEEQTWRGLGQKLRRCPCRIAARRQPRARTAVAGVFSKFRGRKGKKKKKNSTQFFLLFLYFFLNWAPREHSGLPRSARRLPAQLQGNKLLKALMGFCPRLFY